MKSNKFSRLFSVFALSLSVFSAGNSEGSGSAAASLGKKDNAVLVLDQDYEKLKGCFVASAASASVDDRKKAFLTDAEIVAAERAGKADVDAIKAHDVSGQFLSESTHGNLLQLKIGERTEGAINRKVEEISLIYDMFAKRLRPKDDGIERAQIREHSWRDSRLFMGDYTTALKSVHRILFGPDFIRTFSGQVRAAYELANPACEVSEVVKKQERVKLFLENKSKRDEVDVILKEIAELERDWLSIWFRQKRDVGKMFVPGAMSAKEVSAQLEIFDSSDWIHDEHPSLKNVFFAFNRIANNSDMGMLLLKVLFRPAFLSAIGVDQGLTSLAYAADPKLGKQLQTQINKVKNFFGKHTVGLIMEDKLKDTFFGKKTAEAKADIWKKLCEDMDMGGMGFKTGTIVRGGLAIYGGLVLLSIWKFFGLANHMSKMKGVLNAQGTLCKIHRLKDLMERLCVVVGKDTLPKIRDLEQFLDGDDGQEFSGLLKSINSSNFSGSASWFSHHGKTIRTFVLFEKLKEKLGRAMEAIGQIDFYVATAKVFERMKGGQNSFCFPEIVESEKPVFEAKGMWDVFIDSKIAVPNDLSLGVDSSSGKRGALVSGPNFGGKSVFLRGMLTSVLLAQSLGICPAKEMKLSPFTNFDTYVTVQDDPAAQQSLFSAEMLRVKSLFDVMDKSVDQGKKVFIIADELLTGTKTKYAEALVRASLKRLGSYDHGAYIFATHFDGVIQNAAADTAGAFTNYKVMAKVDDEGFYKKPLFKVEPGVSDIDSALFVAEQRLGREHNDVVRDAKNILLKSQGKVSGA